MPVEVEIRGPLTERKYESLFKLLKKKGKLTKEADQLAIFFRTPQHNLSLKKDHDLEKLVLKFGDWGVGSRREIEVFLQKGHFENALSLLKALGYTKGHHVPAFRQDFLYQGVQISLKTKAVIGPHFEMETTVENHKMESKIKKSLLKIAKSLKLKVWTDKQYKTHTHKMWEAYHPGPEDL
jgi:predicted adenylyl cyclase CyaB